MRCPFGCRQHHRRQRSVERSTAYYQTDSGKFKKERLNARRSGHSIPIDCDPLNSKLSDPAPRRNELPQQVELRLEGTVLDELAVKTSPMLPYLRTVIHLIDGIQLSLKQLVISLLSAMRQHSIVYRTRADYILCFLHQHPP